MLTSLLLVANMVACLLLVVAVSRLWSRVETMSLLFTYTAVYLHDNFYDFANFDEPPEEDDYYDD